MVQSNPKYSHITWGESYSVIFGTISKWARDFQILIIKDFQNTKSKWRLLERLTIKDFQNTRSKWKDYWKDYQKFPGSFMIVLGLQIFFKIPKTSLMMIPQNLFLILFWLFKYANWACLKFADICLCLTK